MIELFIFILSTVVFSFGGVCISRIPEGKSVIGGRSECDSCGSIIKWYDLIPVLSFIMLRGKCRNCGSRISVYCFVIELIGGVIGLLCYWLNGIGINFIISFLICFMLVVIGFIDQFTMDIYTSTIVVLGLLCLLYRIVNGIDVMNLILSMFTVSGFMLIMLMVVKGSFGFGDVELMFVSGLFLSFEQMLLAFFIGVMFAGIAGIVMLIRGKRSGSDHMAFGLYLVSGIIISYFFGYQLIMWYLGLFI